MGEVVSHFIIMRLCIIAFFMAFAYLAKAKDLAPVFSLSEERSSSGAPQINVRFQNGVSDSLILSISERDKDLMLRTGVEECRYFGHLENEPDACVVMTGCPGLEDLEFTILSKNVQDSPAFVWTVDGSVEIVNLSDKHFTHEEVNYNLRNFPEFEMRATPPPAMQVGLRIGYGDLFKQKVGNPEKYIRDGMAHAQAYYCHASFGSQIDLYYPTIEHTPGFVFRTRASDSSSTKSTWQDLRTRMQKLTEDTLGDMDLRVYVGYDEDTNDRQSGLASVGVVCDRSQYNSQKWSINEYDKRVSSFGSTVAHEMGHNLGLSHDFGLADTSCNCEGIMSYAGQYGCPVNLPPKWSHCSKAAFVSHYNKIVSSGLQWCMAEFSDQKAPSCSTSKLCNTATFNDGVCDDINNKEECSYDGGDCCDYKQGWDSRCKENNGDCTCKEKCKDGKYGTSTNWCNENVVAKGSCDATGCTFGGVPMACGEGCKRGCSKCDQSDCQDLGTIMGNYGDDFCAQIVKNGLCNKNNDACGKETCGDLCKKSCDQCKPDPTKLCDKDKFNDGVCDDLNNNEMCSFDGGDCCDYKPGWNARCKDCRCKEECKDGTYGTSTDWCAQNIVSKNSCEATGCTSGGVSMPCGQVCKRGCKKCDEGTCKDVGSIFGKGNDFCTQIKNNGLCDKTDASCGKESCGDLCRKTCDKCKPDPLPSCRDIGNPQYNNFCGSITSFGLCNQNHGACGSKICGELCMKSCGKCT